ncbi:uncharacterized protein BP5553_00144 [Venustampulla echinocandica]|uniref:Biogenesis of lysosome-related organelles complex 1 subunit 1 n=1 Tax=Venustampulla echinocandica TaxID=2656787 RepID=A0A370TXA8_9HELO|nr:uncharacterized protein BP5553_00144 [Venustampulla echinocandica]RDL40165.1 hypothetical protein BP5553_00144 [Venustampulla echinocandica]
MSTTASTSAASGPSHSHSLSQSNSQSLSHTSTMPSSPSPESARQIAEARAVLEASMSNIGASLDTSLRSRATTLHANSAQLEKQQKDVVKETAKLRKETDKLKKAADEGARKVKELGNVQNWAEMLERDFLVLEETLRLAEQGSDSDSWESDSGSEGSGRSSRRGSVDGDGKRESEGEVVAQKGAIVPRAVDAEGDVAMDGVAEQNVQDKRKARMEVDASPITVHEQTAEPQPEVVGGSSTATLDSSETEPSLSSVHTTLSVAS